MTAPAAPTQPTRRVARFIKPPADDGLLMLVARLKKIHVA
ncbi:Uncharacterised protein [Mycobacteroides abscessus subsp. abscessus]|nr:Uncharacterised protein [Mycobacteroides abscessus subsp. abscessus]